MPANSAPTPAPRPTTRAIAQAANVSSMTVSLALRHHPKISDATRQRILRIAARLGYRPDPHVAKLMHYLRTRRKPRYHSTLCALTTFPDKQGGFYLDGILIGAQRRAEELGHGLSVMRFEDRPGARADLQRILRSRGVEGLLLLPMSRPRDCTELLAWGDFSVITATYGVVAPEFHRVVPHQFGNTLLLCERLRALGYRRIGLVLPARHDVTVHHGFSGAVAWQSLLGDSAPIRPFVYDRDEPAALRHWFRTERPDVIITAGEEDERTVARQLRIEVPGKIGFASAAVDPDRPGGFAGIVERPSEIGARAIDLLTGMILRGEKGVPGVPTVTMIEGIWHDAKSVRPQRKDSTHHPVRG